MASLWRFILVTWVLCKVQLSRAYIPALPTNDTSALAQSDDLLHLAYYNGPFSVFSADVARQLLAEGFGDDGNYTNTTTIIPWTRYSKGVLLHFDEGLRNQPPAAAPWLALISCDTNGTSFSEVDDIFTICRDLGAQAALLYSLTSQGCEINAEYLDSYEKVLDVYATTSLQNARIIESQFGNVNSSAWQYNSEALNTSATIIDALLANNALSVVGNVPINATTTENVDESETIASSTSTSDYETSSTTTDLLAGSTTGTIDQPSTSATLRRVKRQAASESILSTRSPSTRTSATRTRAVPSPTVAINYLGAVIAARNLTVGGLNSSAAPSATQTGRSNDGPNTGLAMIILYSITGVVTFLFFAVILCGAIRAIRYPERYGPRAGFGYGNRATGSGGNGGAQNRAQGLARAVLDTFPVVRFGGGNSNEGQERRDEEVGAADADSQKDGGKEVETGEIELTQLAPVLSAAPRVVPQRVESEGGGTGFEGVDSTDFDIGRESRSIHSHESSSALPSSQNDSSLGHLSVIGPSSLPSSSFAPPVLDTTPLPASFAAASPLPTTTMTATDEEQPSCPICVCDFAPGDSIRILPCDGRHQFHVDCIDPWLLGVSRLCPLCRLDLGASHGVGEGGVIGQAVSETPVTEETEGDREARERERERHEEERVVRHLRGLLNRGTTSPSSTTGGGTRRTRSNSQNPLDSLSTSLNPLGALELNDQATRDTVGLRSRFAKYVAVRRRRRDVSSSATPVLDPLF